MKNLIRSHILGLKPYSNARSENSSVGIHLDANENSLGSVGGIPANRYPDPYQTALKNKIASLKKINPEHIFIGNGSDEPIDLLIRLFCEPKEDEILICPPTYGMYEVSAAIHNISVSKVPLLPNFDLDILSVLKSIRSNTKIIFICSPNNPTGNCFRKEDIHEILEKYSHGIVVIDEAYIDFCEEKSQLKNIEKYPNLVILQTFSKAWGLAALRLGMAFASREIIDFLTKIKAPYNITQQTQELGLNALENYVQKSNFVENIVELRKNLEERLQKIPSVLKIFPSEANFILVQFRESETVFKNLLDKNIIVRDRSSQLYCQDCLRITIGTKEENEALLHALQDSK